MKITGQFDRHYQILRREGIRVAICRAVHKVLAVPGEIEEGRQLVNRHLRNLYGNTVAHGVFKGMRLSEDQWWDREYQANKILGTYEQHISKVLENLADPDGILIDIGAANGYFAIGCLKRGFFSRAICFEMSPTGRKQIQKNSELNGVAEMVSVKGVADRAKIIDLLANVPSGTVLCDIEGAEFELFDADVLRACSQMNVIIELHDWTPDRQKRSKLIERASEFAHVSVVRRDEIEFGGFPELDNFRDDHRLLAFSEGRRRVGEWLLLTPASQGDWDAPVAAERSGQGT